MSNRFRETKATNAKHAELLRAMLKRPENKLCGDCKRNDARWASTNLGVFLCIRCSGIHRGLGVHISRVRSVDLDTWSPEQISTMDRWGNTKVNLYWEAHLKPGHQPPEHKMEQFIRSKYESKRWAMEGPVPDPATLGDALPHESAPAVPAASSSQAVAPPPPRQQPKPSAVDLLGGAFSDAPTSSLGGASSAKAPASLAYPAAPSARTTTAAPQTAPQQQRGPTAAQVNGGGLFDLDFNAPAASAGSNTTSTSAGARKNTADIMSLFGSSSAMSAPPAPTSSSASGMDAFASLNLGGGSSSTSSYNQQQAVPASAGFGGGASSSSFFSGSSNQVPSFASPNPPAYGSSQSQQQPQSRAASNSISGGNPWAAPAPSSSTNNSLFSAPAASAPYAAPQTSTSASKPASSGLDFYNSQDIWGGSSASTQSGASRAGGADDGGFGGFSSSKNTSSAFDDLWN